MDECSGERWLPVVGWEGYYEVSDHGNVRSVDRTIVTSLGVVRRLRGVPLIATPGRDGRRTVKLSLRCAPITKVVHQLVLLAFLGPRPDPTMQGCHENGDHADDHLTNLRWDTASSNMLDKQRHGTDHQRNKLCCPLSHALSAPNLVAHRIANGHRVCLACSRARSNEQRATARGDTFDFKASADDHYARIMAVV